MTSAIRARRNGTRSRRAHLHRGASAIVATALVVLITPGVSHADSLPAAPGCSVLPADNVWHANVSNLPVDPKSATYIASIGASSPLHPDFGSGKYRGQPIGIAYNVVPASQPLVPVKFQFASESDAGPYPIAKKVSIEGGPRSKGDRHVLVVDSGNCTDYELYAAHKHGGKSWTAGSGAVFPLNSDAHGSAPAFEGQRRHSRRSPPPIRSSSRPSRPTA